MAYCKAAAAARVAASASAGSPRLARRSAAAAPRRALASASVTPVELDVSQLVAAKGKVVVEPESVVNTTAGGVLLSTSANKGDQSFKLGSVVAVGEGVESACAKGDKVLFAFRSGVEVSAGEGSVIFLNDDEVLGIVS